MDFKDRIKKFIRRNGKTDFLSKLNPYSKILDVGCGNNAPYHTKQILPDCDYTGIDIADHNQTKPLLANKYIITTPQDFANKIRELPKNFDAVVSSHNLEHCDDRGSTLAAMLNVIKIGGKLYISFPCEESINFPRRSGVLNYYDDSTHKYLPPKFMETLTTIKEHGFIIEYSERNYSPAILRLIGFLLEPLSKHRNMKMLGAWEYYGFESIIIAKRINDPNLV